MGVLVKKCVYDKAGEKTLTFLSCCVTSAITSGISYCMFGTRPVFVFYEVNITSLLCVPIWFSLLELTQMLILQKFQKKRQLLNLRPLWVYFVFICFCWCSCFSFRESLCKLDHTTQYTFLHEEILLCGNNQYVFGSVSTIMLFQQR